ncbi:MAG: hypothetical protein DRI89_03580 [Bacteroidetes bacterium]|nr:MAG: hypothetical protein DRI89_03580 [Bacteroidota bacterium]
MKKLILSLLIVAATFFTSQAQNKVYATSSLEMIFSFAQTNNNGTPGGNILRWAPVFNVQVFGNADFGKHFGLIFGGAVRNVGFIYQVPDTNINLKKKYRNYNLAIPIGFKIGNMHKFLFFGGYEIEFPFHYKEKTFINNAKQDNKITAWFSPRVPSFYNSAFLGVQFPYGFTLKFKYYFSEFFNQNYTQSDGVQPYKGFKANVWYISLSFAMFKNNHIYYKEKAEKKADYY